MRSFERGERVHLALVSRGYDGRLPTPQVGMRRSWPIAAMLPVGAALILLAGGRHMVIELDHVVYVYPDGTPAFARRLAGYRFRERVALLGPNGAGQDDAGAASERRAEPRGGAGAWPGRPSGPTLSGETRRMVGLVSRILMTSCSCRPCVRMWPSAPRTTDSTTSQAGGPGTLGRGDAERRGQGTPPPVVRSAATGRDCDGAEHGPAHPGTR